MLSSYGSSCLLIELFAAEQTPFFIFHVTGRHYPNYTCPQTAEHNECEAAIKRFPERDIQAVTGPPHFVVANKDLFHLIRRVLVPVYMVNVATIPVKPRNDHTLIVAYCIHKLIRLSRS